MRRLLVAAFFALSASASVPPGRSPQVCAATLRALGDAFRDTAVGLEIDPFRDAVRRLRNSGVPLVLESDPTSLHALEADFESTLARLDSSADAQQELDRFRQHWGLAEEQLVELLLPYRLYPGRYRVVLTRLMPDEADVQQLGAWAKYRHYLAEAPALQARYEFYLANVGRRTVPQMAHELRQQHNDAGIDESRVRKELSALHLAISEALAEPIDGTARASLNRLLQIRRLAALPSGATSRGEVLAHAAREGFPLADVATAIGMSEREAEFFLHFYRVRPRGVPWSRGTEDALGIRRTEEAYLRLLHGRGLFLVAIAAELNEAAGRANQDTYSPDHADYRTYGAVRAQLKELGLSSSLTVRIADVTVPGFATVKSNGALVAPEAMALLRARRSAGWSMERIARELHVTAGTLREFERKHSQLYDTGLPTVLSRFLRPPGPGGAPASPRPPPPLAPVTATPPPAPGADLAFDAFSEHFREATAEWPSSTQELLASELAKIRERLDFTDEEWSALLAPTPFSEFRHARSDAEAAAGSRVRQGRWGMYQLFRQLQQRHDARSPLAQLPVDTLRSTWEIRRALEAFRGEPFPYPPVGFHPAFDRFSAFFRAGTEGWEISPEVQELELDRIRKHLGTSEEEWKTVRGDLAASAGKGARMKETAPSARPKLIRGQQFRFYQFLRRAIAAHSEKKPNGKRLTDGHLEAEAGIRDAIETLRGETLGREFAPGFNAAFEDFYSAFRSVAEDSSVGAKTTFESEMEKIRERYQLTHVEWAKLADGIKASTGPRARLNETTRAENSASVLEIRHARHELFVFFRRLIAHHNALHKTPTLSEDQLRSAGGIREVIEVLQGAPLTPPWTPGRNPAFDKFAASFKLGTKNLALTDGKNFQLALARGYGHLRSDDLRFEERWIRSVQGVTSTAMASARAKNAYAVRYQYDLFRLLNQWMGMHNEAYPDRRLDEKLLETPEGIRQVFYTAQGLPVPVAAIAVPKPDDETKPDPVRDAFIRNFREAVKKWTIHRAPSLETEMEKIRVHLGITSADWAKNYSRISGTFGQRLRVNETRPQTLEAQARHAVAMRKLLYAALLEWIALHNARNPKDLLKHEDLTTSAGIQKTIETLRGAPFVSVVDPNSPDGKFQSTFAVAAKSWSVSTRELWAAELERIRVHCGIFPDQWTVLARKMKPTTGKSLCANPDREGVAPGKRSNILKQRLNARDLFLALIPIYNAKHGGSLAASDLESEAGIRKVVGALRGGTLP